MEYTINKLAKLAGVSVRTLHFYDQAGLLRPKRTAENGYRLYGHDELIRLQQVLFFRELKFPLRQIKEILESPQCNQIEVLQQQEKLLKLERDRLSQILQTISKTINTTKGLTSMNDTEIYEGLDREEMEKYAEEAKQRWGNTDAYKQSEQRMSKLTKEEKDQLAINAEKATRDFADHMSEGFDSPTVQKLVDDQFKGINEMFYDCSIEMFRSLAEMTTADEQYAKYYRRFHPDLPEFRLKAVQYYCDQH